MPKAEAKPRSAESYLAWARLWAKYIDLALYEVIVAVILGALFPSFGKLNQYAAGLLILPPGLLIDAAVLFLFGSSIGKAICGVKVVAAGGSRPTFMQHLQRNFSIWLWLGLGIPIAALFTLTSAYRTLKDTGLAKWDKDAKTNVISRGSTPGRTTIGAVIYFLIICGFAAVTVWAEQRTSTRNAVASATAPQPTRQQQIEELATTIRAKLPTRVDKITTLTKVEPGPDSITYYYQLAVTKARYSAAVDALQAGLLTVYCDAKKGLGAVGISAIYDYSNATSHLGSISLNPSQCPPVPTTGSPVP